MARQRSLGVAVIFTVVAFSLGNERFTNAFTAEGLASFPLGQLPLLLFIETVMLIFLWMRATSGEYQMLRDHAQEFIPPLPSSSLPIIVGLALLVGLMTYFTKNIVVYSAIMACFKLSETWGIWLLHTKIKIGIADGRKTAPAEDERREAWNTIEQYYFERPQIQSAITVMFFAFVSLTLGLASRLPSQQPVSDQLLAASYTIMIVNIAVAEIVYARWRRRRDQSLGETYQ